jgi:hypothetical protein
VTLMNSRRLWRELFIADPLECEWTSSPTRDASAALDA